MLTFTNFRILYVKEDVSLTLFPFFFLVARARRAEPTPRQRAGNCHKTAIGQSEEAEVRRARRVQPGQSSQRPPEVHRRDSPQGVPLFRRQVRNHHEHSEYTHT